MAPGSKRKVLCRPAMVAGCLTMTLALSPAALAQPHPLAGTWIAVDDGFPRLVASGMLVPTEEILHIGPDGRAESRLMHTTGLETHYMCATGWGCSDTLPVRMAKAELNGGALAFSNRRPAPGTEKITKPAQLLAASLTLIAASPQWVVSLEADGARARFESGSMTRHFAKIDPDRLNKLRSALMPLAVSYTQHWRCFLSNATAGDPAFDAVGGPRRSPGAWFEHYLTAVAEYHRLNILTVAPYPGDALSTTDRDHANSAAMQVTHSMLGPNVRWPRSLAERMTYRAPLMAISASASLGNERLGAELARNLDASYSGHGVSAAGLEALRKVMRREAQDDPEVRSLFCLDIKDVPQPRRDYDPFRGRTAN
jgi:hypothetical protein